MFTTDERPIPPPDRPTVVLLHSSAGSPRQWQALVDLLRHDFRVVPLEFHGHGMRTDWPAGQAFELADDARLAQPLLAQSGGAHLVGHSYGAAVALKIASLHPQAVRSVVAFEPVMFGLLFDDLVHPQHAREVMAMANGMRDRLHNQQPDRAAKLFAEFWSGPGAWQALSAPAKEAMAARMPSVMLHFDALFDEPFEREALARFPQPMLFLYGARTPPAARRMGQLLRMSLPLAEHEELPVMGHMGPVTHPAHVNARIVQFLQRASSRVPPAPRRDMP